MTNALALMGAVIAVTAGTIWLGPLLYVFDWISVFLTLSGTALLLVYTYGFSAVSRHLFGGYLRIFQPNKSPVWYDTDHAKAARIAKSGILFSMLTGAMATLIGAVQMLQNMSDPSAIGPAMSVALLTLLYALLLSALVFMPLVRFHASEARALSAKDEDETLFHTAWVFMLVSFAMLGLFSILIVIFTGGET